MTDLRDLSFEDAINKMIAQVEEAKRQSREAKKRNKEEAKRKAKKGSDYVPLPRIKLVDSPAWREVALVLFHTTTHCNCCGRTYEAPTQILIQREHPEMGRHLIDYTALPCTDSRVCDLERRVEHRVQVLPYCQHCFDLECLIEEALTNPGMNQLSLKLEVVK